MMMYNGKGEAVGKVENFDKNGKPTKEWIRYKLATNWKHKKQRMRWRLLSLLTFGLGEGIWY